MDYFQDAFGSFNPQIDQDAAVKFALNSVLMDERLRELSYLLSDGHEIGGIEGEPGWIIERRDTGPSGDHFYYASWPSNKYFHAHVDSSGYELAHPDIFMEVGEFRSYVNKAIEAFVARNPSKLAMAQPIISLLQSTR